MNMTNSNSGQTLIKRLNLEDRVGNERVRRYVLQCTLASLVVLALLLLLDTVTQTVLIAALGASTFIAFAVPRSLQSGPRYLIGGYVVGITIGCLMGTMYSAMHFSDATLAHAVMVLFGALATGLAMFTMVVTKTEHPPAAALALGLVLNEWSLLTLVVVFAGVLGLSVCKQLILPVLLDLH
jgi:CBS-domain-containing membrane protein